MLQQWLLLHHSTFHSVYISTQIYDFIMYVLENSTFHSVYISTLRPDDPAFPEALYIPLCLY